MYRYSKFVSALQGRKWSEWKNEWNYKSVLRNARFKLPIGNQVKNSNYIKSSAQPAHLLPMQVFYILQTLDRQIHHLHGSAWCR